MVHGKQSKVVKNPARTPVYVSPNQLVIAGFETPFEQALTSENRWVKLSRLLPWDKMVAQYNKCFKSSEGRPALNGRIVIGAVIIKHMLKLSDRETVQQIQENVFMQYFLGYSTFTNEAPFDPSLFVDIRQRLSLEVMSRINELIIAHHFDNVAANKNDDQKQNPGNSSGGNATQQSTQPAIHSSEPDTLNVMPAAGVAAPSVSHKGKLLMDATVAPQNITFPTDLKLLNAAREKSEELIDVLYRKELHGHLKPRTYRNIARKAFVDIAKKKHKTAKQLYKANGKQLRFLKRNLTHIGTLLKAYIRFPLRPKEQKYLLVLHTVYDQQYQMHSTHTNRIDDRIVNIHQPHVRPIKRGKDGKKVEFGSKIQVSLSDGFALIDKLSWDNFNEGGWLQISVEQYRQRFGYYPQAVLADKIYCTRYNRNTLRELGIELRAKPLGRPAASALHNQVSPGERNPVEGKFGQAKAGYNMECIKAKLRTTSESWIASIILVLNLVNLARGASHCLSQRILTIVERLIKMIALYTENFGRLIWKMS